MPYGISIFWCPGSGSIDFAEFEKYVIDNNLSKPSADEFGLEMKEAFEMFDLDQSGYIDVGEFKKLMTTLGEAVSVVSFMLSDVFWGQ